MDNCWESGKYNQKFQLDIGSSSNINAPLFLIAAHQKTQRTNLDSTTNPPAKLSNTRFNNAIFDVLNVEQYFVEIDSMRYPKDPIMTNYPENNYLNQ